jgi:ElaB/YqjD/DUF883 family membrane-anchored ribosome-binding protein
LDTLLDTVGPLLRRVDDVLSTGGAPPEHPVWSEVRRVRLLPWDAVLAVAALRPDAMREAVRELRADVHAYVAVADSLLSPGIWSGEAAEAYDRARKRAADHLSGGAESLDERLAATADLAEAMVDWMVRARDDLAATLAEVLSSAEGLLLSFRIDANPPEARDVSAAAEVAVDVLRTIAAGYDVADDLLRGSTRLAAPLPA